jgi:hypothetical protein
MLPKKIQNCVHLRHLRYNKYETDFYFNKKTETFFAQVPPAETLRAPSVEELERLVRKHHEEYLVPGQWLKKIYVVVTGSQGEDGGSLFYGHQNYGKSRSLNVAFTIFEERDGGCPPGTRLGRAWDPDPDPRWEDDRDRVYGQDCKDALERTPRTRRMALRSRFWNGPRSGRTPSATSRRPWPSCSPRLGVVVKKPELVAGLAQGPPRIWEGLMPIQFWWREGHL